VKRVWTLVSSAVLVIVMAVAIAVTPTNFVAWAPGPTVALLGPAGSQPIFQIAGREPSGLAGQIMTTSMTQTGQTSALTLPFLVMDYFLPNHNVLPRDTVYPSGQSTSEATDAHRQDIQASRAEAMAAGVKQAGITVVERPSVTAVRQNGPSNQLLLPGDFILAIDGTTMNTTNDIRQYIRNKQVGDQVVVTVLRGNTTLQVTIPKLAGSSTDGTVPTLGITGGTGYSYPVTIQFDQDVDQGDTAQGLALALATYVILADDADISGLTMAAVGNISAAGDVSAVSGINEHAISAWQGHATILFIPQANCSEIADQTNGMAIVPVTSLSDAVSALHNHIANGTAWPHC